MKIPPIEVPFVVPVVVALVVIFGAWIYYANRRLWPELLWAGRRVFRCQDCGEVYVASEDRPSASCPRCGRFNEAVRR